MFTGRDSKQSLFNCRGEVCVVRVVKPLNYTSYKLFCEMTVGECMVYGIWLTTVKIFVIIFKSKPQKFLFGYDDSMYELKVKLLQFIFSAYLLYRFENIFPVVLIYRQVFAPFCRTSVELRAPAFIDE